MNIFKEANQSQKKGDGYKARRFKIIWKSKSCSWNYIVIDWGIRWSDNWQLFPIWNVSNNCSRSLLFGIWKVYFQISYKRKDSFNQRRKFLFRKKLWRFYQLVN